MSGSTSIGLICTIVLAIAFAWIAVAHHTPVPLIGLGGVVVVFIFFIYLPVKVIKLLSKILEEIESLNNK